MSEHNTVTPSGYQRNSVAELVSYIDREPNAQIRDRTGQEMDGEELQRLIDESERHEMSRHIIISPENAETLDRTEMSQMAKRTLRDTLGAREGVHYCYAVHTEGGDRPHTHVAATGRASEAGDPLWLDADDLENLAEVAQEKSKEVERGQVLTQSLEKAPERGVQLSE